MNFNFLFFLFVYLFTIERASAGVTPTLKPSEDPFYRAPQGYENATLGTVLRMRRTPHKLRSVYFPVNIKGSWQIMVRSSDTFGNPTTVVATIMEPYNADPSKLVAHLTAEDSSCVNCAPSYAFLSGSSNATKSTQIEMAYIRTMLERGWYVMTPDYEGPNAAFTAGILSGHTTLDAIRGTLNSRNETGISDDVRIVIYGYSGGSYAGGWAAAIQPTYAKDLKPYLAGATLGGMVPNITQIAVSIDKTEFVGLTAMAIVGLMKEYPKVEAYMDGQILHNDTSFKAAYELCLLDAYAHFKNQSMFEGPNRYIKDGWGIFHGTVVSDAIYQNTLGEKKDQVPEIPIFVYHGLKDTLSPFPNVEKMYNHWCDWGIESFEFAVDESAGHLSEIVLGSPASFAWVEKIFNGEAPVKGCKRTDRPNNLMYPGSDYSLYSFFKSAFIASIGGNIGPNGEGLDSSSSNSTSKRGLWNGLPGYSLSY